MFLNKEALMIRAHDNASSLIGQVGHCCGFTNIAE